MENSVFGLTVLDSWENELEHGIDEESEEAEFGSTYTMASGLGAGADSISDTVFRLVKRSLFLPPEAHEQMLNCYLPFSFGALNLSSSFVYATSLKALALQAEQVFLGIGSGSGYFTAVVSMLLGESGVCHGIELSGRAFHHSLKFTANFKLLLEMFRERSAQAGSQAGSTRIGISAKVLLQKPPVINLLWGDAFEIDESRLFLKYDRIYIGAACSEVNLKQFANLLRPGGIMVGCCNGYLTQVTRRALGECEIVPLCPVSMPYMFQSCSSSNVETSSVSPLQRPRAKGITEQLNELVCAYDVHPAVHNTFPSCYQRCVTAIFAYQRRQEGSDDEFHDGGLIGRLPLAIWREILSFTHRGWFLASSYASSNGVSPPSSRGKRKRPPPGFSKSDDEMERTGKRSLRGQPSESSVAEKPPAYTSTPSSCVERETFGRKQRKKQVRFAVGTKVCGPNTKSAEAPEAGTGEAKGDKLSCRALYMKEYNEQAQQRWSRWKLPKEEEEEGSNGQGEETVLLSEFGGRVRIPTAFRDKRRILGDALSAALHASTPKGKE